MTVRTPPAWLQGGSHTAENDRLMLGALVPQEGAVSSTDMLVTQNATANMTVNVASGSVFIKNDLATWGGTYHMVNDATVNLAIAAANATNPRNDLVVARVRDSSYFGGTNDAAVAVITGTAAATPADPAIPTDGSYLVLARVRVNANATTIVDANITDLRPRASVPANVASPIGSVTAYAGATAPAGWLLCDGSAVSRTTYATLFGIVGTTYGAGDGSSTFNIPDIRGRSPLGAGAGTGLTNRTLGAAGGAETVTLALAEVPGHSHTVNSHAHAGSGVSTGDATHIHGTGASAAHDHSVDGDYGTRIVISHGAGVDRLSSSGTGGTQTPVTVSTIDAGSGSHDHGNTQGASGNANHGHGLTIAGDTPGTNSQGGGGAHANMHPWLALNYIIRAF